MRTMDQHTRDYIANQLLTTRDVAALTGVKEVTVKKRIEYGTIDAVKQEPDYLCFRRDFVARQDPAKALLNQLVELLYRCWFPITRKDCLS